MNGTVLPSSSNPTTLSTCTLRIWKSCAMREQSSVVTSCIVNPPRDGRRGQKNGCGGRLSRPRLNSLQTSDVLKTSKDWNKQLCPVGYSRTIPSGCQVGNGRTAFSSAGFCPSRLDPVGGTILVGLLRVALEVTQSFEHVVHSVVAPIRVLSQAAKAEALEVRCHPGVEVARRWWVQRADLL